MITNIIYKYKNIILLTIGILLIIISFCLLFYDRIELLKEGVYNEIELLKYHEDNGYEEVIEENNSLEIDGIDTQEIEEENQEDEEQIKATETKKTKEYIGYLEISKINLRTGFVSKKSYYNNVNRNMEMLSASDYPDKDKGNTIFAAHSGSGYISFFKNLYKLERGDTAKIYYKQKIYTYKISNIYNVPKVGYVSINRDINKTTLTLITCTKNSKTEQTVYILDLINVESEVKV